MYKTEYVKDWYVYRETGSRLDADYRLKSCREINRADEIKALTEKGIIPHVCIHNSQSRWRLTYEATQYQEMEKHPEKSIKAQ